jgi:hypothetical protein
VFNDRTKKSTFGDGSKGPVFQPLKTSITWRFFVDGSVGWPNGADIAPETLYAASRGERSLTSAS